MDTSFRFMPFFSPDAAGAGQAGGQADAGADDKGKGGAAADDKSKAGGQEAVTFDKWIGTQAEPIKTLITEHEKGLKSALESERTSRQDLEGQLRDMAKKAAK